MINARNYITVRNQCTRNCTCAALLACRTCNVLYILRYCVLYITDQQSTTDEESSENRCQAEKFKRFEGNEGIWRKQSKCFPVELFAI
jgi:hypothetical protein